METPEKSAASGEACITENYHSSIPKCGFYKIDSTQPIWYVDKVPVLASAIWKPKGASKSTLGLEVQVSLLNLFFGIASQEDKELLRSGDLHQCFLIVSDVNITDGDNGERQLMIHWNLRKHIQPISNSELNALLQSEKGDVLIEAFLANKDNHALYIDDEMEDYGDDPVHDDFETLTDDPED
jgi:hypothetical protein